MYFTLNNPFYRKFKDYNMFYFREWPRSRQRFLEVMVYSSDAYFAFELELSLSQFTIAVFGYGFSIGTYSNFVAEPMEIKVNVDG